MERSAISSLIKQIDEKWPNRKKESDLSEGNMLSFHANLDGNKESSDQLVNQLVDMAKNGEDDDRIFCIVYQGRRASREQKNKFWKWQKDEEDRNDLITIYFNPENIKKFKKFNIKILEKPKRSRTKNNDFPGTNVLQFKKRNKSVKKMQDKLTSKGFFISEKEKGYYGSETCYAVSRYYREVLGIRSGNIARNGNKFGPRAWERLFEDAMGN